MERLGLVGSVGLGGRLSPVVTQSRRSSVLDSAALFGVGRVRRVSLCGRSLVTA